MSVKLKICSFNLRVDNTVDGINQFIYRKGRVLETISTEAPDLIGFQEAKDSMREWLTDELRDYFVLGCGRDADYRGESTVIAVKRACFEVVSSETFWLSYTPNVPGSRFEGDQSKCPRVCTVALLRHRESDGLFRFCNTHLDHKGEQAKLLGIAEVMEYLSRFPEKFALTGDFNAEPGSPVIEAMSHMKHNGRTVADLTAGIESTFHGFGKTTRNVKIDYIYTDAEADPADSYAVVKPPIDGVYISDHHPVIAFLTI